MNNLDIIKKFYASDNFRDLTLVDELFDEKAILNWYSSVGYFKYNKEEILKLSKEIYINYVKTKIELETIFGENDQVAAKYKFYAATIENPNDLVLIANIMIIWQFENGKIIKGYQSSYI